MNKILTLTAAVLFATSVSAADQKEAAKANKPVFTIVKENPITSIKDQNRSGTCWDYSTLSFFEAEILKKTGKTYDLCESFVANKNYMDRAKTVVRMHGDAQFSQGGSAYDVLYVLKNYGICPQDAMPFPGSLTGDSLYNFNEFFSVMEPYVKAVATNKAPKISNQWKQGLQSILDAYLGKCPESFTYKGKTYTPKSFAASLGLNWNDYETFTSYTHHPFYTAFPVEVQDNWRQPASWNLPMEEMMKIIDNAVMNGYTIAWGGDVSEPGFTRDGLAYMVDGKKIQSTKGSDMARWLGLSAAKKKDIIAELGVNVPEVKASQELRQERFDNWELTDDHGMVIFGIAKDQNGKEYYMVKNSWGETGAYKGIWYITKTFIAANTMDFMVNKNAVPKDIRKKLGI
ncbi:MAG: C1 family peptidase [Prevotella bivia]|uniref:Aminopeptidase n=2 Tax=Prevotella bivia TaxID=28125 RepID=I4Z6M0_9BACT|nr:C1 family peptidase [Prevotella bivia]EIM31862.1 aminopeptidase C [Prevotella bivia DSM 20514]KGF24024.1 aminopeptidase [Prevotella bivia DNF00188]KGF38589.1 aminopeptidase [Prevotella bivia DNF00650]KXO17872.1 peptidase C1-like family protein [Prevotella bivia]MDU3909045.1 C1 family peptidase [Prevotella bivia]